VCEEKDLATCLNAKDYDGCDQDIKRYTLSSSFRNFLEVGASFANGPNLL